MADPLPPLLPQVLNELRLLCTLEHNCLVPLLDAFYLDGEVARADRKKRTEAPLKQPSVCHQ